MEEGALSWWHVREAWTVEKITETEQWIEEKTRVGREKMTPLLGVTESWDAMGSDAMGAEVRDERSVDLQSEMLENEVGRGRSCVTDVKTEARRCGQGESGADDEEGRLGSDANQESDTLRCDGRKTPDWEKNRGFKNRRGTKKVGK